MRALLSLVFMFFASTAFAGGKLSLEPRYNPKTEQVTYTVGVAVYEQFMKGKLALNSWTGFGDALTEDSQEVSFSKWYVTKNALDFNLNKTFTISPGFRLGYRPRDGQFSKDTVVTEAFGKLSIKLW